MGIDTIYIYEMQDPYDSDEFERSLNDRNETIGDIPVTGSLKGLCAICETEPEKLMVKYERCFEGVKKRFSEHVCKECFDDPDYQDVLKGKRIISITKL
jgi:hypothetical protein